MNKYFFTVAMAVLLIGLMPQESLAQQPFRWVQDNIDVYNLEVIRVDGQRLTTRVTELDGRRTFRVPNEFRFYIDGRPVDVKQLQPRQRLTAYVTRAPGGKLILVDAGPPRTSPPVTPPKAPVVAVQAPAPAPAMLPKTASPVPLAGLVGLLLLATAMGIRSLRHRG